MMKIEIAIDPTKTTMRIGAGAKQAGPHFILPRPGIINKYR
jgi:hypothetical protein